MMTVDQMIEVLTAYKAGKKIQFSYGGKWIDCHNNNPAFDFINTGYRVKPEPKVIWVNEYKDGDGYGHTTRKNAEEASRDQHIRIAVRYVESPEG